MLCKLVQISWCLWTARLWHQENARGSRYILSTRGESIAVLWGKYSLWAKVTIDETATWSRRSFFIGRLHGAKAVRTANRKPGNAATARQCRRSIKAPGRRQLALVQRRLHWSAL